MELGFLLLTDHSEALNGKLYAMGGGWNMLRFNQLPVQHVFGIAFGVDVNWDEANERHTIELETQDPDGSVDSRASAHQGYGPGWEPLSRAGYTVFGGSHAGTVEPADFDRITTPRRLSLIPVEPIADEHPGTAFAITPPWYKRVWLEPEYEGTD